jgi:hypothetical protein
VRSSRRAISRPTSRLGLGPGAPLTFGALAGNARSARSVRSRTRIPGSYRRADGPVLLGDLPTGFAFLRSLHGRAAADGGGCRARRSARARQRSPARKPCGVVTGGRRARFPRRIAAGPDARGRRPGVAELEADRLPGDRARGVPLGSRREPGGPGFPRRQRPAPRARSASGCTSRRAPAPRREEALGEAALEGPAGDRAPARRRCRTLGSGPRVGRVGRAEGNRPLEETHFGGVGAVTRFPHERLALFCSPPSPSGSQSRGVPLREAPDFSAHGLAAPPGRSTSRPARQYHGRWGLRGLFRLRPQAPRRRPEGLPSALLAQEKLLDWSKASGGPEGARADGRLDWVKGPRPSAGIGGKARDGRPPGTGPSSAARPGSRSDERARVGVARAPRRPHLLEPTRRAVESRARGARRRKDYWVDGSRLVDLGGDVGSSRSSTRCLNHRPAGAAGEHEREGADRDGAAGRAVLPCASSRGFGERAGLRRRARDEPRHRSIRPDLTRRQRPPARTRRRGRSSSPGP